MYIALRFPKSVSWKISKEDPMFWEIGDGLKIKMLDPALTQSLSEQDNEYPFGKGTGYNFTVLRDGEFYSVNSDLIFTFDNQEDSEKAEQYFLRVLSKAASNKRQFNAARPKYTVYMAGTGDLSSNYLQIRLVTHKAPIANFLINTAISYEDFQEASNNIDEKEIYADMFMFAIDSYFNDDYISTFLYCGMTCEIALGLACDNDYDSAIVDFKNGISSNFRIEEINTPKGKVYKDPIYDILKSIGFSNRLRNLPLYSKNRSIITENDRLFKVISRIYLTRNKIVHLGSTKDEDTAYSINQENALEAIANVGEFIEWLGLKGGFPSPELVDGRLQWIFRAG